MREIKYTSFSVVRYEKANNVGRPRYRRFYFKTSSVRQYQEKTFGENREMSAIVILKNSKTHYRRYRFGTFTFKSVRVGLSTQWIKLLMTKTRKQADTLPRNAYRFADEHGPRRQVKLNVMRLRKSDTTQYVKSWLIDKTLSGIPI